MRFTTAYTGSQDDIALRLLGTRKTAAIVTARSGFNLQLSFAEFTKLRNFPQVDFAEPGFDVVEGKRESPE